MPGMAAILRLAALVLLLAFLLMPQSFAPLFAPLTQYGAPPIYDQGNLLTLALAHLGVVCCAAAASTLVAVGLGVLVTRPSGAQFLPLSINRTEFRLTPALGQMVVSLENRVSGGSEALLVPLDD